jgi:4-amino-4-deoxy-L-arabinose transferase-like glycosyltransferase
VKGKPRPKARVDDDGTLPLSARMQALILALLCLGTFAGGLTGGFVLDDSRAIVTHPVVQGTASPLDAFSLNFWGESLDAKPPSYRPLATLSFALDHRLFGESGLAFHLSSLLWYIGLVLAGWAFARRCMSPRAALVAMALFVVMPVHVENVSSLVGRADTMSVLLAMLALLALSPSIVDGEAATPRRLMLAGGAFFAALLCKESVAALPLITVLFVEYRRRRAETSPPLWRAHLPSLVMFGVLGVYAFIRLRVQPETFSYVSDDDVLVGASFGEKVGYGLELLSRYAGLVVAPVGLCTGRKYAEVFRPASLSLAMVVGASLCGLAAYASWRAYRRGRLPFALAAFTAWVLITGLVFAMPESMADRFLLLPSLFLSLSLGPTLSSLVAGSRGRQVLLLMAVGVQAVLSNFQARTWHDEGALWSHAVRACPDSLHNHFRYAEYLSRQGNTAEAVWHYAVFSKGRHAFPYAWSHPAADEERSLPADQRVREMHDLLGITISEPVWRERFEMYLRSIGRWREAQLVAETSPSR